MIDILDTWYDHRRYTAISADEVRKLPDGSPVIRLWADRYGEPTWAKCVVATKGNTRVLRAVLYGTSSEYTIRASAKLRYLVDKLKG